MTDSPAFQAPLDPKEAPILDRVLYLRDQLSLLKQDKSTYIKSHDVLALYVQVIEQVHELNTIREEHGKPLEQNRGSFWSNTASRNTIAILRLTMLVHSRQCVGRLLPIDFSLLLDHRAQQ